MRVMEEVFPKLYRAVSIFGMNYKINLSVTARRFTKNVTFTRKPAIQRVFLLIA